MKLRIHAIVLLVAASIPVLARADNWTGIGVFFGVPIMAIASLLYGVLAVFRRVHGAIYGLATLIFAPLVWFGIFVVEDAINLLQRQGDTDAVFLYFSLFGLAIALYAIIAWKFWRRPPLRRAS